MKFVSMMSTGVAILAVTAASTQATSQNPQTATTTPPEQQVTVVGCVQKESDYRRMRDQGSGGVAGTGIGTGNEFVLTHASAGTVGTSGANPSTPTGVAGNSAASASNSTGTMSYELTGANEGQVGQYAGQRVEVFGKLKRQEIGPAGPTGGPTVGAPPSGIDLASKDLKLRELEVVSVRMATGTCPAQ